jgi:hypothetical protein
LKSAPTLNGGDAETGVGLRLVDVLGPPHGDQGSSVESIGHKRHGIGDGERIAIQKHQQVAGSGLLGDLEGEVIQLAGMWAALVEYAVKVDRVGRVDVLERRPRLVGDRDVLAEISRLDLDPSG